MAYHRQGAEGFSNQHRVQQSFGASAQYSVLPPLSFLETVTVQSSCFSTGINDALKGRAVFETLITNKQLQGAVIKSSLLQGVLIVSAIVIKPLLNRIQDHSPSQSTSGWAFVLFHVLWLYPLALAATYYSGLLRTPKGRGKSVQSLTPFRGITSAVISESYRVFILINYLAGLFALRLIPYVGPVLSFLYACIIDSYYCFEASWEKSGHGLSERIEKFETRWVYHLGFGLPITLVCVWSNDPIVNFSLFSLFFPLVQIMTTSSMPQPLDPDLPTSSLSLSFLPQSSGSSFSMAAAEGGEEARGRSSSPYFPKRLRLLWPTDYLYSFLMKNFVPSNSTKKDASGFSGGGHYNQPPPQSYGHDMGGWRNGNSGIPNRYPQSSAPPPPPPQSNQYYEKAGAEAQYDTPSPSRRGHQSTESSIGVASSVPGRVGGGGGDKQLDSLISAAARRRKGD